MSNTSPSNANTGLGGSIFLDLIPNGVRDEGEFSVTDVVVELLNADGSPALDSNGNAITTTTDSQGNYSFTGIAAGEYQVKFVAPEGLTFTIANIGDDDTINSDVNPFTGLTRTVVISDGEFNNTLGAGLVSPAGVGNLVFEDTNANGIQDEGELGIAGVEVRLLADTDNDGNINDVVAITTTGADGSYAFNGLTPGDYRVQFVQPDGFDTVSPFQAGFDISQDSDANPENSLTSNVITLSQGRFESRIDAGFFQKTPGLGGSVFIDQNVNGVRDEGEFSVTNVVVELLNADGSPALDSEGNAITTTTDNQGNYSFFNLTPGEYQVNFIAPEGFTFTVANVGDDTINSDVNPFTGLTRTVVINDGDFNDSLGAGLVRPSGVGNLVFEDTNANGIQDEGEQGIAGVEVRLLSDTDNDGQIDDVVVTTTTAADGTYAFNNLTPGAYRVQFVQPEGFDTVSPFQAGFDISSDSDANPAANLTSDVITLNQGGFESRIDAGFFQKTPGLGSSVFIDQNVNGIRDAGEFGVANVVVELLNADGSPALDSEGNAITTTTDNQGNYSFFAVTPGEYQLNFVAPEGFTFTTANVGDDDTINSDVNPFTGLTRTVIINDGDFNDTLGAGLVRPAGVGNFVFEDTNANGIQDEGEQGIAGVEVNLLTDIDNDGQIDDVAATTTTGADGSYEFNNLTPGDYRVQFVQPDGFNSVSPFQAGFDISSDSDANPDNNLTSDVFTLNQGGFETRIDAGFFNTAQPKDIQFKFTGSSPLDGPDGNVRTFSSEGVSVEVSAFRSDKNGTNFDKAYLGAYGSGLGVTNRNESWQHHRTDNGYSLDYVLFEFEQEVILDRAFLNSVGYDSDISVWIGDRNGVDITHLDSNLLNSFTQENNFTHSSYSRWADLNADELAGDTIIISAYTEGSNDSFKLNKLDVTVTDYVAPTEPTEYVYEAEDLSLYGYKVEDLGSDIASGGEAIKLLGHYGEAAVNFEGSTGEYDIVIGYYDESDGIAQGSLEVDGKHVEGWFFNEYSDSSLPTTDNVRERTIENVHLETGDELRLLGQRSYNEFARFDYIRVVASDTTDDTANVYADTSAFS